MNSDILPLYIKYTKMNKPDIGANPIAYIYTKIWPIDFDTTIKCPNKVT
jgi:hypothetical protein